MPNIFAAADAKSSAAVSLIFGERLRLIPQRSGRLTVASGADPDREVKDFIGTLSGELGTLSLSGQERGGGFQSGINFRDRAVTADYKDWPAWAKVGDLIKALDQPGEPEFKISAEPVDDGSGNRVIAALVTT